MKFQFFFRKGITFGPKGAIIDSNIQVNQTITYSLSNNVMMYKQMTTLSGGGGGGVGSSVLSGSLTLSPTGVTSGKITGSGTDQQGNSFSKVAPLCARVQ